MDCSMKQLVITSTNWSVRIYIYIYIYICSKTKTNSEMVIDLVPLLIQCHAELVLKQRLIWLINLLLLHENNVHSGSGKAISKPPNPGCSEYCLFCSRKRRVNSLSHEAYGSKFNISLGQNGHHFAVDLFKGIFLNENFWTLNKISLKHVPYGLINNMTALIKAWRRTVDKPLSEPMLARFIDTYMRHYIYIGEIN